MKFLKVAWVISIGLGTAWAAGQIAPGSAGPDRQIELAQAEQAPGDAAVDLEGLSPEEIEAQMAEIEAALGEEEVLEEFVPSEPLSADISVGLPSDI